MVIELLPHYRVVESGNKLVYLNTGIRGYPQGLRAGADPKNPCIIVDQGFNEVTFEGVPYRISSLEVWGCGDIQSRYITIFIFIIVNYRKRIYKFLINL